jgi:hypothetical protein
METSKFSDFTDTQFEKGVRVHTEGAFTIPPIFSNKSEVIIQNFSNRFFKEKLHILSSICIFVTPIIKFRQTSKYTIYKCLGIFLPYIKF